MNIDGVIINYVIINFVIKYFDIINAMEMYRIISTD